MMVFLNPQSGIRSTYGFRTQGGTYYLYRFPSAVLPKKPNEASLVSHLGVATTEGVEIKILFKKLKLSVPRHTFSNHVFRVMDDENYEQTETPLGPPVQFRKHSQIHPITHSRRLFKPFVKNDLSKTTTSLVFTSCFPTTTRRIRNVNTGILILLIWVIALSTH